MAIQVLFPLDGSDRSHEAMVDGLRLLAGADLDVTLLCVMQEGFEDADSDRVQGFDEDEHDEVFPNQDSCDRMLGRAVERCKALGVEATTKVVQGKVPRAILEECASFDLVVMHALDKAQLKEKLRMSSTEKLARQATCSVLLVQDRG